jgi:hypothetical protein
VINLELIRQEQDRSLKALKAELETVAECLEAEMPEPGITRALLVSAGHHRPTPTRHVFDHTRRNGDVFEFIFRCRDTDARRVWGNYCVDAWRAMRGVP